MRWIGVLAFVGWLLLVVVLITRHPADGSVTGRAVTVEPHRLCVTGDREVCLTVDAPSRLAGIDEGTCVRARYSSDGLLIAVEPRTDCR